MLTDLQNQFSFYFYGDSNSNNPQKAPKSEKKQPFMIHPTIWPMTNSLRGTKTASIDEKYSLFDVDF